MTQSLSFNVIISQEYLHMKKLRNVVLYNYAMTSGVDIASFDKVFALSFHVAVTEI